MLKPVGTLALAATLASAQDIGPGTASAPYLLPSADGVRTVSVLTVGESPSDGSGYRMVGTPDGLGVLPHADGRFTLLMNHELSRNEGIARRHGRRGAFVSEWTLTPDLEVVTGRDLIHTTYRYSRSTREFVAAPVTLQRYCSSDLPPTTAFRFGAFGTDARIYLTGEEVRPPSSPDHGRAFAHVLDEDGAAAYELPWMGRMSFENVVASPMPQKRTLVFGTDDASSSTSPSGTPSELYLYVGTKQRLGTPIERAGLVGGSLYGLRIPGTDASESRSNGFGDGSFVGTARFDLVDFGDVSDRSGIELQTESIQRDVYRFIRIEDGAWDPRPTHARDFYFVTTGTGSTGTSRVFRVRFDNLRRPELGGEITIMLTGDEGHRSLDNAGMDRFGNLIIQEDPGGSGLLASVWQLNVDTGAFKRLAQANPDFFLPREPGFLTTNEESSGIVDASDVLGPGWFLLDVQAHYSLETELDEGGQLLAMFNPDSVCMADVNADGVSDRADLLSFISMFLSQDPAADTNLDGVIDASDLVAFVHRWIGGC